MSNANVAPVVKKAPRARKTKTEPVEPTPEPVAEAPAPKLTVEEQLAQAKAQLKAKKEEAARRKWVAEKREKNPQFTGKSRPVTDEDALLHTHGSVLWEIKCATCGASRWVNAQDTHQVRYCEDHRKNAAKAAAKARREKNKPAGKSVEAQLEATLALLAKLDDTES